MNRRQERAVPRKPGGRHFHRVGYFTDGALLIWEYPRTTPDGEQMDFVEIMEIRDGFIQHHRVYWGCCGVDRNRQGVAVLGLRMSADRQWMEVRLSQFARAGYGS